MDDIDAVGERDRDGERSALSDREACDWESVRLHESDTELRESVALFDSETEVVRSPVRDRLCDRECVGVGGGVTVRVIVTVRVRSTV